VDNLLLASCETPECGVDIFFKLHRRILWIDACGISNILDDLRVDPLHMLVEPIRFFPQIFLGVRFCCHQALVHFSVILLIIHE